MSYTYSENKIDLIINKVPRSIYKQLQENGEISENEIYLITDPIIDAANDKIINVADPTDETDASNKKYVDQQALSVLQDALANLAGKSTVRISIPENGVQNDLSVLNIVKLTKAKYQQLEQAGQILSSNLYIVETTDNDVLFGGNAFTC